MRTPPCKLSLLLTMSSSVRAFVQNLISQNNVMVRLRHRKNMDYLMKWHAHSCLFCRCSLRVIARKILPGVYDELTYVYTYCPSIYLSMYI